MTPDPRPDSPAEAGTPAGSGPFIPPGMPPGTEYAASEKAPDGVVFFRIYAVVFGIMGALLALAGLGLMFAPLFAPPSLAGAEVGTWFAGLFYGGWGMAMFVPTVLALFSGRRPWVHTMGTVVIALGMFSCCLMPLLIPLLIAWMKPEPKRWYGAR
jgi:hypothetical protein